MVFVTSITFLRYFVFVTVCLGFFVIIAYINMCTSRVFVIQLLLPDDIRFVIEDEEVEYKRGCYLVVHAFMAVAI